jgi:WD40 repeat protein
VILNNELFTRFYSLFCPLCLTLRRYLITGGSDAFVRIFKADCIEEEPLTLEFHDEPILALATVGKGNIQDHWWLATASEDHCVRLFTVNPRSDGTKLSYNDEKRAKPLDSFDSETLCTEFDRLLTRMTLAIRSLSFSTDGNWLAVAGEELHLKILDMRHIEKDGSDSVPVFVLRGHSHSLKSICFGQNHVLMSVSVDGTVKIWSFRDDNTGWDCSRTINDLFTMADLE